MLYIAKNYDKELFCVEDRPDIRFMEGFFLPE
jgi:hypothetical protein